MSAHTPGVDGVSSVAVNGYTVERSPARHTTKPWVVLSPRGGRMASFRTREQAEEAARRYETVPEVELRMEVGK